MRRAAWLLLATVACAHAPAAPAPRTPPPPAPPRAGPPLAAIPVVGAPVWGKTSEAAGAQARATRRGVLMVFCANWAIPCKQLAKGAFADPAVTTEMSTHFILVPIDMTQESDAATAAVAKQHGVAGVPTLIAFDADGRERGRATEAITGAELLELLSRAATALPAGPALAALNEGACDLSVEELLSAEVLRGVPPGWHGEPGEASRLEAEQTPYLACSYRIRMGTYHYRFHRTSHVGEPRRGLLTPMACVEVGEMTAALAEIRRATAGCRDPSRGRPSGVELEAT
jgi:hypothetical protein